MPDAAKKQVEIGLVLQGGGALGAYECGAITALLDMMDEAAAHGAPIVLKAVSGVSIGAINAACVVGAKNRGDARRRLAALWEALALETPFFWPPAASRDLSLFGLPGFYAPRPDVWAFPTWTHWYDTSPLLATLTRHVDFAALNTSATAFIVTAVDVESGKLARFSNRASDGEPPTEIGPKHILASGSLPPQFPWTGIAGHRFWDGGIVDNTPLGDVIEAFTPGDAVDRLLIVMNLYPLRARLPQNLADVEDRVHELAFGNRTRQDGAVARRINALVETVEELATLVPAKSLEPPAASPHRRGAPLQGHRRDHPYRHAGPGRRRTARRAAAIRRPAWSARLLSRDGDAPPRRRPCCRARKAAAAVPTHGLMTETRGRRAAAATRV